MKVLGLDYGKARIGLALGDAETRLASPWGVLENKGRAFVLRSLQELIQLEDIQALVVGIPHGLKRPDQETRQSQEIRAFIKELAVLGLPVHEEDETLSSAQALKQVHKRGERGKRDDLEATIILQSFFDRSSKEQFKV